MKSVVSPSTDVSIVPALYFVVPISAIVFPYDSEIKIESSVIVLPSS